MTQNLTETLLRGDYPPEQYMRPGTLKLRGDTRRPEAGVFPDLDSKGVSAASQ